MKNWKTILSQNVTCLDEAAALLALPLEKLACRPSLPVNIPRRLLKKMKKGQLDDPITRQFIPLREEELIVPGYTTDPLREEGCRMGRLLSKFHGRLLLLANPSCSMHCRFCFRRHTRHAKASTFEKELGAIRQSTDCQELILSGGDPLMSSNSELRKLLHAAASIPHIERIRIHTRAPIGIPERIDAEFLDIIGHMPRQVVFVIHTNHADELDDEVLEALGRLRRRGIPILSQTVLLRGVNDSLAALEGLFRTLINHGIMPYYLHALDKVHGTSHFDVCRKEGVLLHQALVKKLPGYGVPRFVEERAGAAAKTHIPCHLKRTYGA
jgi:EF-P beta-lysylation protein EpmB